LKNLAKDLDCPVLVLSQLSRNSNDTNVEPKSSDLRDSGSIEQDADVIALMWRQEKEDKTRINIKIDKNRNGPVGFQTLQFIPEKTLFPYQ
jgi:replicative DNA helicase